MSWAKPEYSRSRVNRAGRQIMDPSCSRDDREVALSIVHNWRNAHAYPLNTFQMSQRPRARKVDPSADTVQRTKRLPSIEAKLKLKPKMGLARMHDIGGCRSVLATTAMAEGLAERCLNARHEHQLDGDPYDYISSPKPDGYRGIHLVYQHFSKAHPEYDRMRIEIQIRSRPQHHWATAVETAGTFLHQDLKRGQGDPAWLRFFSLASSLFAHFEDRAPVPGTPGTITDLRQEITELERSLDALKRLAGFGQVLRIIENETTLSGAALYLLEQDLDSGVMMITPFQSRHRHEAVARYEAAERRAADSERVDIVLVAADSIETLRRAYPNYFADTHEFVRSISDHIAGRL